MPPPWNHSIILGEIEENLNQGKYMALHRGHKFLISHIMSLVERLRWSLAMVVAQDITDGEAPGVE